MKVLKLRRILKYPERRLWMFNLSVGGFIINGFVYSQDTGAILSPTTRMGGKKIRMVRAFGMQMKRLRELLEKEIVNLPVQPTQLTQPASSSPSPLSTSQEPVSLLPPAHEGEPLQDENTLSASFAKVA